jgi:nitrate/nitrite-specific signal transduction histidine kinase
MGKLTQYIRSSMPIWSWREYKQSIHLNTNKSENLTFPDFALDIALDTATINDLNTECPRLLSIIEQSLNFSFTEQEKSQIYLVVFDNVNTLIPNIIHTNINKPDKNLINYLGYHLSNLKQEDHGRVNFSLPHCKGDFYRHKLSIESDKQVWLVLFFQNEMPSLTFIQHYSSHTFHAISRGLNAFFSRQAKIEQAVLDERASQAAELHDSMAQILGYLCLKTSQLVTHCQEADYKVKNNNVLKALSKDIAYQTHSAYRSTRELISTSRLSTQNKSLPECIHDAIAEFEQQSNVVFELDNRMMSINSVLSRERKEQEAQLQFIVREALSNVARHSHATHARVKLYSNGHDLTITIEDNGNGIREENKRHDSFGLHIMEERAKKINAFFCIKDRIPHGTIVEIKHSLSKSPLL